MGLTHKAFMVPTRMTGKNQHEVLMFKRGNILFLPSVEYKEVQEETIRESFKNLFNEVLLEPNFLMRKGFSLPNCPDTFFYSGSFLNKYLATIKGNSHKVESIQYCGPEILQVKNGTKIEKVTLSILKCYFARKRY